MSPSSSAAFLVPLRPLPRTAAPPSASLPLLFHPSALPQPTHLLRLRPMASPRLRLRPRAVATTSIPSMEGKDPEQWTKAEYDAILQGGDQVASLLQEMLSVLEDMELDESTEPVALQIAAHGVVGKRVDEMETGFMMALDYMIQLAEKDRDDKRKSLLEVIKQTVLDHLSKKCPPQVQVVGLLCRTPKKESRHELLRRVAGGGGVFESEKGVILHLPKANLNDIANQADDILETMEARPTVPDRKLLARLVLIREEVRNMMGGGLLDERNDRGLNTLPEAEVSFLGKLVALRPGRNLRAMIKNVMLGKDEGADKSGSGQNDAYSNSGHEDIEEEDLEIDDQYSGDAVDKRRMSGRNLGPVRPGMFLESVSKVLGGVYAGNVSGITAQHLEWVHQNTLEILQEIAF